MALAVSVTGVGIAVHVAPARGTCAREGDWAGEAVDGLQGELIGGCLSGCDCGGRCTHVGWVDDKVHCCAGKIN